MMDIMVSQVLIAIGKLCWDFLMERLYLNDDYEMYDGMIFKANHTLFSVNKN